MLESALIDVRVLPWRPRARVMEPDTLRENVDPFSAFDDLQGVVVGLVLWLVVIIAAPLIVRIAGHEHTAADPLTPTATAILNALGISAQ